MVVDHNQSKLDVLDRFDTVLREEIKIFKNEIKETFSSIVSKEVKLNVEVIRSDVKSIQKTLQEASDVKEREANLLMFRLAESDDDRSNVLKILKHLTDVSEKYVIKIMRLGGKCETVVRPILIKLDCVLLRDSIMRNVYKFKSLKEFSHVRLNYDLTKDQRQEFKSFVDKVKVMEKKTIKIDLIICSQDFQISDIKIFPNADAGLFSELLQNIEVECSISLPNEKWKLHNNVASLNSSRNFDVDYIQKNDFNDEIGDNIKLIKKKLNLPLFGVVDQKLNISLYGHPRHRKN
ncbi:hypothetical protein HELRODRAFT_174303 [Helobdella robusta]|uniref:Uncharacterized protein n=1 Tax=Helobdella robusta TaxID=6412 RepID=T1F7Z1_HELRO|nr:hypothetical protein HELRODRAFT_174303 [Helobdella robusta]ESO02867.1 hypothetical protein HELRODRAFT_174303 [Helobdella robusta]